MMPKLYITMKTPDAVEDAIKEYVEREEEECAQDPDMDEVERDNVRENRIDEIKAICGKWFRSGELVTLAVDLEAETIEVTR